LVSTAFLVYSVNVYVKVASDLIYSPTSAWWKQTAVIGSACLHSAVDLPATPNPRAWTSLYMDGTTMFDLPT
jgi:hypothetical protein